MPIIAGGEGHPHQPRYRNFSIRRGERVAQLVPAAVTQARWVEVEVLDETVRGEGGFGSTGGEPGSMLT
jgi:dUTPase